MLPQSSNTLTSSIPNMTSKLIHVCIKPPVQAMGTLPNAANVRWPDQPYNYLRRTFPELSDAGLALLNGLLTYDAVQRMTAQQALKHQYFKVKSSVSFNCTKAQYVSAVVIRHAKLSDAFMNPIKLLHIYALFSRPPACQQ